MTPKTKQEKVAELNKKYRDDNRRRSASINTDERVDGFLAVMLEGYEGSLANVTKFLDQTTEQLDSAAKQRDDIIGKIAELKDILGMSDEVEAPDLELVKE